MSDIQCPFCGTTASIRTDNNGDKIAVCPNDDCERIIIDVLPADEGPTGLAGFYSQRSAS